MFDFDFDLKEKIAIAGFVLILISIPVSFSLVKNTQIFKSKAAETNDQGSSQSILGGIPRPTAAPKAVSSTSPLTELQSLLQNSPSTSPASTTPTPTLEANLTFGPTLNLKIELEGRPKEKQATKAFVGLSSGSASQKPTYLLTFTIDFPNSGVFRGLSLAGLNPGSTYTTYLKGSAQIDTSSTFVMGATETNLNNNQALSLTTGDLNEDNTINSADYTIAKSSYGTTSTSQNWNGRADFNLDGVINNLDLSIITKNLGKTGSSDTWYSPPPATSSGTPSSSYWLFVP